MNTGGESSYTAQQCENAIAARVRATTASPEMDPYFSIRMTPSRARIALLQLSLFIQCRRDCWANLLANCDALPMRQRLMEHEYDELVEDEYSSKGHYDFLVRQGVIVSFLPKYVSNQPRALKAADDALELFKLYHLGVAEEMERAG